MNRIIREPSTYAGLAGLFTAIAAALSGRYEEAAAIGVPAILGVVMREKGEGAANG